MRSVTDSVTERTTRGPGYLDCVFRSAPGTVEAGDMRDALFQLFFVLASAYGGIRVVDDVKWVRERKLARVASK